MELLSFPPHAELPRGDSTQIFQKPDVNLPLTCGQGPCASLLSITTESQVQHGGLLALQSSPNGRGSPSSGVPPSSYAFPPQIFIWIQSTQKGKSIQLQARPESGCSDVTNATKTPKLPKTKVLPNSADNLCTSRLPNTLTSFQGS